jgi:ferritin
VFALRAGSFTQKFDAIEESFNSIERSSEMLSKKMLDALNEQMRKEFHSAYIYLAMAAHFEGKNLPGMATWMKAQYQEEIEHAIKFFDHIVERGETPVVQGFDTPKSDYSSVLEVFEAALEHEKFITRSINEVYDVAVAENDRPAQIMLQWFVTEQVEEEDNVGQVADTIKMIGEQGQALFMLDRQLGQRQE